MESLKKQQRIKQKKKIPISLLNKVAKVASDRFILRVGIDEYL